MSSAIRLLISANVLPREDETTAWFIELVNDWFDLMTSRRPCNGKPIKVTVKVKVQTYFLYRFNVQTLKAAYFPMSI